jgi:tape measure domain-containing protein
LNKLESAIQNVTIKFSEINVDSSAISRTINEELAKIKITVSDVALDLKTDITKALKTEGTITVGAMQLNLKSLIQTAVNKEGVISVSNFSLNLAEVIQSELARKITIKDLALELPVDEITSAISIENAANFGKVINDAINRLSSRIATEVTELKLFSESTITVGNVDLTKSIQEKLDSVEINIDRILLGELINQRLQQQGIVLDEISIDLNPLIGAKLAEIKFAEIDTSLFVTEVSNYIQKVATAIKNSSIETAKPVDVEPVAISTSNTKKAIEAAIEVQEIVLNLQKLIQAEVTAKTTINPAVLKLQGFLDRELAKVNTLTSDIKVSQNIPSGVEAVVDTSEVNTEIKIISEEPNILQADIDLTGINKQVNLISEEPHNIEAEVTTTGVNNQVNLIADLSSNVEADVKATIDTTNVNPQVDLIHEPTTTLQARINTADVNTTVNLSSSAPINIDTTPVSPDVQLVSSGTSIIPAVVDLTGVNRDVKLVSSEVNILPADIDVTEINKKVNLVSEETVRINVDMPNAALTALGFIGDVDNIAQELIDTFRGITQLLTSQLSSITVDLDPLRNSFQITIDRISGLIRSIELPDTGSGYEPIEQPIVPLSGSQQKTNDITNLFSGAIADQEEIIRLAQEGGDPKTNKEIQKLIKGKIDKLGQMLNLLSEIELPDPASLMQIATEFSNLKQLANTSMSSNTKGSFSSVLGVKAGGKANSDQAKAYEAVYTPVGQLPTDKINNLDLIPNLQKSRLTDRVKQIEAGTKPADFYAASGESGRFTPSEMQARNENAAGGFYTTASQELAEIRKEAHKAFENFKKENLQEYEKFISELHQQYAIKGSLFTRPTGDIKNFVERYPYLAKQELNAYKEITPWQNNNPESSVEPMDWETETKAEDIKPSTDSKTRVTNKIVEILNKDISDIFSDVASKLTAKQNKISVTNDPTYYANNDLEYTPSSELPGEATLNSPLNFRVSDTGDIDQKTLDFQNAEEILRVREEAIQAALDASVVETPNLNVPSRPIIENSFDDEDFATVTIDEVSEPVVPRKVREAATLADQAIDEAIKVYAALKQQLKGLVKQGQIVDIDQLSEAFKNIPSGERKNKKREELKTDKEFFKTANQKTDLAAQANDLVSQAQEFINSGQGDPAAIKAAIGKILSNPNFKAARKLLKDAVKGIERELDRLDTVPADASEGAGMTKTKYGEMLNQKITAFKEKLRQVETEIVKKVNDVGEAIIPDVNGLIAAFNDLFPSQQKNEELPFVKTRNKANQRIEEINTPVQATTDETRKNSLSIKSYEISSSILDGVKVTDEAFNDLLAIANSFEDEVKKAAAIVKAKRKINEGKKSNSKIDELNNGDGGDGDGGDSDGDGGMDPEDPNFNYKAGLARKQIRIGERPDILDLNSAVNSEYDNLDAEDIRLKDIQKQQSILLKNLRENVATAKRQIAQNFDGVDISLPDFNEAGITNRDQQLGISDKILNIQHAFEQWWDNHDLKQAKGDDPALNNSIAKIKTKIALGEDSGGNNQDITDQINKLDQTNDEVKKLIQFRQKEAKAELKRFLQSEILKSNNEIRTIGQYTSDFSYFAGKGLDEELTKALLDLEQAKAKALKKATEENPEFAKELARQKRNLTLGKEVSFSMLDSLAENSDQKQKVDILEKSTNNKELKQAIDQSIKTGNTGSLEALVVNDLEGAKEALDDVLKSLSEDRISNYIKSVKQFKRALAVGVDTSAEVAKAKNKLSYEESQNPDVLIADGDLQKTKQKQRLKELVINKDYDALQAGADSGLEGYSKALNALKKSQENLGRRYSDYVKEINALIAQNRVFEAESKLNTLKGFRGLSVGQKESLNALSGKISSKSDNAQLADVRDAIAAEKIRNIRGLTPDQNNVSAINRSRTFNDDSKATELDTIVNEYKKWAAKEKRALQKATFDDAKLEFRLGNSDPLQAISESVSEFAKEAKAILAKATAELSSLTPEERASLNVYQSASKRALSSGKEEEVEKVLEEYKLRKLKSENSIYNDKFDTITNQLGKGQAKEDNGLRIQDLAIAFYTFFNGLSMASQALGNLAKVASAYEISLNRLTVSSDGRLSQVSNDVSFSERVSNQFSQNRQEVLNTVAGYKIANPTTYDRFGTQVSKPVSDDGINKIIQGLTAAGVANQISAAQMQDATTAVQQMLNKGVVQSEELKRQLSNTIPGAFNLFAQSQGVSPRELEGRLKRSEVTSENIVDFGDLLDRMFSEAAKKATLVKSVNTLVNKSQEVVQSGSAVPGAITQGILDAGVNPLVVGLSKNAASATPGLLLIGGTVGLSLLGGIIEGLKKSDGINSIGKDILAKFYSQKDGFTSLGRASGTLFGAAFLASVGSAAGGEGLDKLLGRVTKNIGIGIDKTLNAATGGKPESVGSGISAVQKATLGNDIVSQILPLAAGLYGVAQLTGYKPSSKALDDRLERIRKNSDGNYQVPYTRLDTKQEKSYSLGLIDEKTNSEHIKKSTSGITGALKGTGEFLGTAMMSAVAGWPMILLTIGSSMALYALGNQKFVDSFTENVKEILIKLEKTKNDIGVKPSKPLTVDQLGNREVDPNNGQTNKFLDYLRNIQTDQEAFNSGDFKALTDRGLADRYKELKKIKDNPADNPNIRINPVEFSKLESEVNRRLKGGQQVSTDYNKVSTDYQFAQSSETAKGIATSIKDILAQNTRNPVGMDAQGVDAQSKLTAAMAKKQEIYNKGILTREDEDALEALNSEITKYNSIYKESVRKFTKRTTELEDTVKQADSAIEEYKKVPEKFKQTKEYRDTLSELEGKRDQAKTQLIASRKETERVDPATQAALAAEKFARKTNYISDLNISLNSEKARESRKSDIQRLTEDNNRGADKRSADLTFRFASGDLKIAEEKLKVTSEYYKSLFLLPKSSETDKNIEETRTKVLEATTAVEEAKTKKIKAYLDKRIVFEQKAIEELELKRTRQDRALGVVESKARAVAPTNDSGVDNYLNNYRSANTNQRALDLLVSQIKDQEQIVRKTEINREAQQEKLLDMRAAAEAKTTELYLSNLQKVRSEIEALNSIAQSIVAAAVALRDVKKNRDDQRSSEIVGNSVKPRLGDLYSTDMSLEESRLRLQRARIDARSFQQTGLSAEFNLLNNERSRQTGFGEGGKVVPLQSLSESTRKYIESLSPEEIQQAIVDATAAMGVTKEILMRQGTGADTSDLEGQNSFRIGNSTPQSIQSVEEGQSLINFLNSAKAFIEQRQSQQDNIKKLELDFRNLAVGKVNTYNTVAKDTRIANDNTVNDNKVKDQEQQDASNNLRNRLASAGITNPINTLVLDINAQLDRNETDAKKRANANIASRRDADEKIKKINADFEASRQGFIDAGILPEATAGKNRQIAEINRGVQVNLQVDRGEAINALVPSIAELFNSLTRSLPRQRQIQNDYEDKRIARQEILTSANVNSGMTEEDRSNQDIAKKVRDFNYSLDASVLSISQEAAIQFNKKPGDPNARADVSSISKRLLETNDPSKIKLGNTINDILRELGSNGLLTANQLAELVEKLKKLGFTAKDVAALQESARIKIIRARKLALDTQDQDISEAREEMNQKQSDQISPYVSDRIMRIRNRVKAEQINNRRRLALDAIDQDEDNDTSARTPERDKKYNNRRELETIKAQTQLNDLQSPSRKLAKDMAEILRSGLKFSQVFREALSDGKWGDALKKMFGGILDSIADYFSNKAADALSKALGSMLDQVLASINFGGIGKVFGFSTGMLPSKATGDFEPIHGSSLPNTPSQDYREPTRSKFAMINGQASIVNATEWVVSGADAHGFVKYKQEENNRKQNEAVQSIYSSNINNTSNSNSTTNHNYLIQEDTFKRSASTNIVINDREEANRRRFKR